MAEAVVQTVFTNSSSILAVWDKNVDQDSALISNKLLSSFPEELLPRPVRRKP